MALQFRGRLVNAAYDEGPGPPPEKTLTRGLQRLTGTVRGATDAIPNVDKGTLGAENEGMLTIGATQGS